jgi:8-oxo-dGTP pyrophosphatase MutT (NUDIX family)
MTVEPWDEVSQGAPDERRIFTVRSDVVRSRRTGKTWQVDRVFCADWVNVVAVTADRELVLVKQWRFGARAFTLELPAGAVEPGEDPLAAGLRELAEETGYAGEARVIGSCLPNPAFMNNRCTTVFAPRVSWTTAQHLDPMEELEVVLVPVQDVDGLLRRGEMTTSLGMVALQWWRLATHDSP